MISRWIEPCAGSLAVGLRLLGVPRSLVGWQGGKSKYADAIMRTLGVERAAEVWCADVSPWVPCWEALSRAGVAHEAADLCERWWSGVRTTADARAVWDVAAGRVREAPEVWGAVEVASWVVRVSGAVMSGPSNGSKWRMTTEPQTYPCGNSQMLGSTVGPTLADRLRTLPPTGLPLRAWHGAASIPPVGGAVVYIDPPYQGTTGYQPGDLDRDGVLTLIESWRSAGSVVAVSETEPLPGGVAVDLGAMIPRPGRRGTLTPEWLTVYGARPREARQGGLFG
mgnify:CR=1 FL=1